MIILVDSREQRELKFKCATLKTALKFGDYGCKFSHIYQHPVVFERKGLNDLFGTLGKNYIRFRREISRAKEAGFTLVIAIETDKDTVRKGIKHSMRDGTSIIIQLNTIQKKYGVDHIYFKSRKEMSDHITNFYQQHYKIFQENLNAIPKEI